MQLEGSGLTLDLEGPPLGSGGEASIFAVPELPNRVAKLYHRPAPEHADKLAAMLAAPPVDPGASASHVSIAWPVQRLLDPTAPARVIGYLMPRVHNVQLIQEFYNPKARLQACPLFHYGYLLRTARNLAISVRALHERGYAIGDLSAANLLVSTQALVTLIDTDSFQVPAPDRIFRSRVGTPEYTPPELQGARFAEVDRGPEHDAFGLAVLIFQLLMQGTHPFAGLYTGNGEPTAIPRRILAGHWPYAQRRLVPFQPSPHAPPWSVLPVPVQELMRRCFEDGHEQPSQRPTAQQWQRALQEAEQTLIPCAVNGQHLFQRGLEGCPWCALAARQGRDPFPSVQAVQATLGTPTRVPPGEDSSVVTKPLSASSSAPVPAPSRRGPERKAPRSRSDEEPGMGSRMLGLTALLGSGVLLVALVLLWNRAASWSAKRHEPGPFPSWLPDANAFHGEFPAELLARFVGHSAAVRSVAFTADGRYFLSGSYDKTVRLWEVDTGRAVSVLLGHTDKVSSVALSPDGRFALSGSHDHTARYWELDSGKELLSFRRHNDWVTGVAFFPDGRSALSCGYDRLIRRWDVTNGREWQQFAGHRGWIECLALSRDGQQMATGGDDKVVRLWTVPGVREVDQFPGHGREIASVAISADGRRALSGSFDNTARLWELAPRRRHLHRFDGHTEAVLSVAFSPDGRLAATGSRDRSMRVWDVAGGREVRRFPGLHGAIYAVAFAPDGSILTGCEDGISYLWRMAEPEKFDHPSDSPLEDESPVGVEDVDLLQGSWTVQFAERDGIVAPPLFYRHLRFDFAGEQLHVRGHDGATLRTVRYQLDALSRPKAIDLELDGPPPQPRSLGLYRCDGERLKIVARYVDGPRPANFDATGAGIDRLILKKVRP